MPLDFACPPAYPPRHPRGACVWKQVESGTSRDPSNLIPVTRAEGGSVFRFKPIGPESPFSLRH